MLSPLITLSPHPDLSLSDFSPDLSLLSLPREGERAKRERERKQREQIEIRREGEIMGETGEREERDRGRESLHVLENGEPPLGDDAGKNHHDGEPPNIVLLLLSIRERSSFFSASNEEMTTRLQRGRRASNLRNFFCYRLKEYGGL